jgi:hypothetical protein
VVLQFAQAVHTNGHQKVNASQAGDDSGGRAQEFAAEK